jgi:hypothetical protein
MTDQDLNVLSNFISLSEDERRKYLKKKPREYLMNLAISCAAKAEREGRDKEEYAAKCERVTKELTDFHQERDRHLEMADQLADAVNRLETENKKLLKVIEAVMTARNLHVIAGAAALEAAQADTVLAELGAEFEAP